MLKLNYDDDVFFATNLEKFTLKVLAQDSDYDLCIVDSMYRGSRNIQNNGVFYPLNEIEGIDEYFNQCFPYVRECATKEDGTIWMVPIEVNIPGLVVSEAWEDSEGSFHDNMTYEEFIHILSGISEQKRQKMGVNEANMELCFFKQYFHTNTFLNRQLFTETIDIMKQSEELLAISDYTLDYVSYIPNSSLISYVSYRLNELNQRGRVYSVPKISATDKNIGTCIFLAVNPKSSNLKETIGYLESYIAYCLAEEDKPLHFIDCDVYQDIYGNSLYDLYKNGEITFAIDSDVYDDGFGSVISGEESCEDYLNKTQQRIDIYFNE